MGSSPSLPKKLSPALGWLILRSSQWGAKKLLSRLGYRWEERRMGDLKIGLWRKDLRLSKKPVKRPQALRRVVLIPGFCDSVVSWLAVLRILRPALRGDYDELVMLELPGFIGLLSYERAFSSLELLAQSVNEVLATLQPKAIIGHSLGAWLAVSYGSYCGTNSKSMRDGKPSPELLILISPPGLFSTAEDKEELKKIFDAVLIKGAVSWRRHIFAKEPVWFRFIFSHMDALMRREEIRQFIQSFEKQSELETQLQHIQADVRLAWGEADTLLPVAAVSVWLDRLKGETRSPYAFVLKDVGHSPHVESPVRMAAALAKLLRGRREEGLKGRWWRVVFS